MIGLGGYGSSYMPVDDVEDDMIFDSGATSPTSNPVHFVGGFASPSSMPPPSTVHFHRVHPQQQQMAPNAAAASIP